MGHGPIRGHAPSTPPPMAPIETALGGARKNWRHAPQNCQPPPHGRIWRGGPKTGAMPPKLGLDPPPLMAAIGAMPHRRRVYLEKIRFREKIRFLFLF